MHTTKNHSCGDMFAPIVIRFSARFDDSRCMTFGFVQRPRQCCVGHEVLDWAA